MTPPETLFTAGETHGRALRPENELVAHSQDVGWRSLHAAIFTEAPLHVTESALDHPFIIYHITHPCEVTRKLEGCDASVAEIVPRFGIIDPLLEQLAIALGEALAHRFGPRRSLCRA